MTKTLAHLVTLAVLVSCTTSGGHIPPGYFLMVSHSSGGPAPYSSNLALYPNRQAMYRSANGKLKSFTISEESLLRIQSLLSKPELLPELHRLTIRSAGYFDYEEWWFSVNEKNFKFVCREVAPSPAATALLEAVRSVARQKTRDEWFLSNLACRMSKTE